MTNPKSHMEFINSFTKKGKKIENLDRIKGLLSAVGNPQDQLKFIHIAGTNGKGSMAQMFSEILCDAGYKTGLFTSPYLIEYNDRIQINGRNIPNDELERISKEIKPVVTALDNYRDFSQFEITQTVAFLYFFQQKCDVVVLETGVGGLLDSTNVIQNPLVSVIGSVSYDHTAILGNTLEEIAAQKAGIIKRNRPCVLSAGNDMAVVRTVRQKAMEMSAQLVIPNLYLCRAKKWGLDGCEFSYKGRDYSLSMGGLHQISNAITVLEAINFVAEKLPLMQENVQNGLSRAKLFGRIEVLSKNPLVILDGGHNSDGMKALAKALETVDKSLKIAVIGMLREKNAADAVRQLIGVVDKFVCIDGFSPLEIKRAELAKIIESVGGSAEVPCTNIRNTIEVTCRSNPDGATVICGSLYLAAEVKRERTGI